MKVITDRDKCIGAGQCVLIAPQVFDQSEDDGTVLLLQEDPPAGTHTAIHQAAAVCPGMAIEVDES